jgi:hypothetical protein
VISFVDPCKPLRKSIGILFKDLEEIGSVVYIQALGLLALICCITNNHIQSSSHGSMSMMHPLQICQYVAYS